MIMHLATHSMISRFLWLTCPVPTSFATVPVRARRCSAVLWCARLPDSQWTSDPPSPPPLHAIADQDRFFPFISTPPNLPHGRMNRSRPERAAQRRTISGFEPCGGLSGPARRSAERDGDVAVLYSVTDHGICASSFPSPCPSSDQITSSYTVRTTRLEQHVSDPPQGPCGGISAYSPR